MEKSKVLVVGGSGYIGRRLVKASLAEGHETYVLQRTEIGLDIDKLQMLLSFKKQGAHLVEASFSDHRSLVDAVKLADVVICAMSGVHFRSHNLLLQLKLVDAIKDAGNVKANTSSRWNIACEDDGGRAVLLEDGTLRENGGGGPVFPAETGNISPQNQERK
ncbi:isoflavone reductase homolog [Arachis duranensis]|uniref:Isoflavone reductase homolog n=1 Tax=Arachis duranensis TaxID=130453 RepID=A0A9C6WTJ1_ARADU|nr:isoflavone reductase homolog [Arachis duranensis]